MSVFVISSDGVGGNFGIRRGERDNRREQEESTKKKKERKKN